jgi:3-oxoadipate enol-lactonase
MSTLDIKDKIDYWMTMLRPAFRAALVLMIGAASVTAAITSCSGMRSRFDPGTLPPGLHWISVNGVPVIYKEAGHGEPVLILTPYPFSTELWTPLVNRLSSSSRVVVVEPVGLRNPASMRGDFSTEHLLQIHRGFVQALGLNKVHVLGVGESGALAVAFGHHFPQHTLTVVSVNGFESVTWTRQIGDMMKSFDKITVPGIKSLLTKTSVRHRIRPPQDLEVTRLLVLPAADQEDDANRTNPVHRRSDAYTLDIKGGYIAAMLPSVDRPLLLIRSEGDDILPSRYIDRTLNQIRRVRVREEAIGGAGHFAFLDQPDQVAQAILQFHALYPASPGATGR